MTRQFVAFFYYVGLCWSLQKSSKTIKELKTTITYVIQWVSIDDTSYMENLKERFRFTLSSDGKHFLYSFFSYNLFSCANLENFKKEPFFRSKVIQFSIIKTMWSTNYLQNFLHSGYFLKSVSWLIISPFIVTNKNIKW